MANTCIVYPTILLGHRYDLDPPATLLRYPLRPCGPPPLRGGPVFLEVSRLYAHAGWTGLFNVLPPPLRGGAPGSGHSSGFSAQAVAAGFVAGLDGLLVAGKEDLVGRVGQVRAAGQVELFGVDVADVGLRSEERRVGKECRSRWSPYH